MIYSLRLDCVLFWQSAFFVSSGRLVMREPRGSKVELLEFDPPKSATVIDLLSVQFTAEWDDGTYTLSYLFYSDEGITWRDKDE